MTLEATIDYSQYGQPSFFRQFIASDAARWVVDAGAHDGIDGSNSRELILEGWSAILIEPLPAAFESLKANCADLPNVRLCQAACGESDGPGTLYIGLDGPEGQTSSLCVEPAWQRNHSGGELPVSVRRLSSILEEEGCPAHFGVLLVDAEGMDFEVLKGLDFGRFRPSVICTEAYATNPDKEKRKDEYLNAAGYRKRGIRGSDTIWSDAGVPFAPMRSDIAPLFHGTSLPPEIAGMPIRGEAPAFLDQLFAVEGQVMISGWAAAPDLSVPTVVVVGLERNGGMEFAQSARHPRSDVARHFRSDAMFFTGFTATFPIQGVPDPARCLVIQVANDDRYENTFSVPLPKGG